MIRTGKEDTFHLISHVMNILQDKIIRFCRWSTIASLSSRTWISSNYLDRIRVWYRKNGKYRKNTLDILYEFFQIPKDHWYYANLKKNVKPSESVLGEIFRKKRINMCMSLHDVASKIHVWVRELARIEAGDSLPSFGSHTMVNLINLYDFNEEEREKIRWFVSILRDLVTMNNEIE